MISSNVELISSQTFEDMDVSKQKQAFKKLFAEIEHAQTIKERKKQILQKYMKKMKSTKNSKLNRQGISV